MGAVRCLLCNTVIVSTHTHDYRVCPCGNAMVDGGDDYLRYGWREPDSVVVVDDSEEK